MVDLPSIPDVAPEVRAPTPRATPADVAQPYLELSAMLDKTSGHLMKDVAEPWAEQAGLTAVSRAPDGSLQMSRAPIFGDAAIAYHRAVKFSALAQGEAEARRADLEISKKFPNDPNAYLQAAQGFRDAHVKEYSDKFGPDVGISLGRAIDNQTTWAYRLMLNKQQSEIRQNFDRDTSSVIKSSAEDVFSLIESGALDTPDGRALVESKINTVHHTILERVQNPVLGAAPEAARVELQRFDQEVGAARYVDGLVKTAKGEGGFNAAMQQLEKDRQSNSTVQGAFNYAAGLAAMKKVETDQEKSITIANRFQKMTDDVFLNNVIADSANDPGKRAITEKDVKTTPGLSPEAREKALTFMHRDDLPEPISRVSHAAWVDLMTRMRSDGPDRLTSDKPIWDALGAGKLNRTDFNALRTEFEQAKSPGGEALARDRTDFFKRFELVLDPGRANGGNRSALGDQRAYAAESEARRLEQQLQAKGDDPHSLYDPASPNYLGKRIQKFAPSLQQIQKYDRDLQKDPTNAEAPPVPSLSTPPNGAVPAGPTKVNTQEEYDALKPGTKFIGPDGKNYQKPEKQ